MHTGKTTLADQLVERYGYTRCSFAAPLKALAAKVGLPLNRENLQNLGHGARELISPDVWVDAFWNGCSNVPRIVVDDMRYPNEYESLVNADAIMVRLESSVETRWKRFQTSDKFDPSVSFEQWELAQHHSTETALDEGYRWDVFVDTDGLTGEEVLAQVLSHAPEIMR